MENKFVVYTALFGNYDNLSEISKKYKNCDFICFTDQLELKSNSWNIVYVESTHHNPIDLNRQYKILPHIFLPEYDHSLYIDSNIKITGSPYLLYEKYLSSTNITCPAHFERDCIYSEGLECIKLNRAPEADVIKLLKRYEDENFPKNYGLAENNIILRNHNNPIIIGLMEQWWDALVSGPKRDQLSLMYILWKNSYPFSYMRESARNKNSFFRYKLHNPQVPQSVFKKISTHFRINQHRSFTYKTIYNIITFFKPKITPNRPRPKL